MKLHGCHNHPPFKDMIQAQSGWTKDGARRNIVQIHNAMSKDCRYSIEKTEDASCLGCVWKSHVEVKIF